MINVAKLLKDAPEGMKLYSPLFGEVEYMQLGDNDKIWIKVDNSEPFDKYGRYFGSHFRDAECLLFPSKNCRTWEGWEAPKPHYDIANFQPFDKVLTRDTENGSWNVNLFSYYIDDKDARVIARFRCINSLWHQCIPFNNDTKHLLGTTDMCDEQYINW